MSSDDGQRTLGSLLAAAEAASPVEAVEAVTRELGLALGATKVSFLIADLSGRALVRLAHVQLRDADGQDVDTRSGAASGVPSRSPPRSCRSTVGRPSVPYAPRRCRSSRPAARAGRRRRIRGWCWPR